jgi:hypothetical protein
MNFASSDIIVGLPRRRAKCRRVLARSGTCQRPGRDRCRCLPSVRLTRSSAAWLLSALLLGGCGGSSSGHGDAQKQITAPAYNGYPAITIPVASGTPAQCRREAQVFSREAVAFLAPFPSDSDTHLVVARLQFFEFKAHRCDVAILRKALSRRATAKQRRAIVASDGFTFLGGMGRELSREN